MDRTENLEIELYMYDQLISNKDDKVIQWGKESQMLEPLGICMENEHQLKIYIYIFFSVSFSY